MATAVGRKVHPVFSGLADIMETRQFDSEKDGECFDALYDYFVEHQMCGRFGVTLLHTHFSVFGNEVLVDYFNRQERILTTEVRSHEDKESIFPWSWRLFQQNDHMALMPNQYLALSADVAEQDFFLNAHDKQILTGLGSVLRDHDALDRFGVRITPSFFALDQGEHLMEYSDQENRTLELVIEAEDTFKASSFIETSWTFLSDLPVEAAARCRLVPNFRCITSCRTKGRGDYATHVTTGHKQTRFGSVHR